jgi:competence ComEA-like helix-hairpin-helix protein
MNKLISLLGISAVVTAIATASLSGVAAQNASPSDDALLPDGPGKVLIKKDCNTCHSSSEITNGGGRSADDWSDVMNSMIDRGAVVSDDDANTIVQYLATNFAPGWKQKRGAAAAGGSAPAAASTAGDNATVNVNKASAQDLQSALGLTADEAAAIVHHREQSGNYKTWQDVAAVPGVSSDKIKQNQQRLTF